jgi:Family of unknown function (DUF6551)
MNIPQTAHHEIIERTLADGTLFVDPNVQRALKKSRVTKMAGKFDPAALGVLTTSLRADGREAIIDGQHRHDTCVTVGYDGVIITHRYSGLSIEQEAALFRKLNTTEKPSAIDQFLLACVEQDPDAVRLAKYMTNHGWTVSAYTGSKRLTAISSLIRVYNLDPAAADATLAVITASWGHQPAAVQGVLIDGIGQMINHYGGLVRLADLTKKLSGYDGGPNGVVGNAKGRHAARTGALSKEVALLLVDVYNLKKKQNALPEWSSVQDRPAIGA